MSYKSVGASIASVDLQGSNRVNLNTTSINADTFEYEEIDYSQDIESDYQVSLMSIADLNQQYGDIYLEYEDDGLIKVVKIRNSTYYLNCEDKNYDYYINEILPNKNYADVVNSTEKYCALYEYINSNKIELDSQSMERLKKLVSINEEYKEKLENIEPTKLSYAEEVQGLIDILNKEIDDLDSKIKPLQEEYNNSMSIVRNPAWFNPNNINGKALDTCERIRPELDSLKGQKAMLETYVYQMKHELALAPYKEMMDTKDYETFIKNYNYDYQNLDYDLLISCSYDPIMYIMQQSRGKTREELDDMLANRENQIDKIAIVEYIIASAPKDKSLDELTYMFPHITDAFINYQFMTEDQRNMYHYLFYKDGEDAANQYLEVISDSINQAYGAKLASDFISTLDLNDKGKLEKNLANFFGVSTKGLSDGIDTFFEGIENVFINNEKLTPEEYEKMIVLQYLSENSNYYDEIYSFNSSLGNMLPSMATSAIVSLLATPAAGAVTGSVLMGTSAGGNAKHQALVEGNSLLSSWLYGIFVGSSEAALGYFLGKIPGISQTSGFTLKNLLCEGTEEFLQEWIDAGLQAVILGKDVDWSKIPEQSAESFFMGVLMSGFLNGGQAIVNISINGVVREINVQKTLNILEQNPNMSIEEALTTTNPSLLDIFRKNKTPGNISTNVLNSNTIANVVSRYHGDYRSAFADILYDVSMNRSTYEVRLACRDLIAYLQAQGVKTENILDIIIDAGTGAINYRGFDSQAVYMDGNSITIKQQTGINYSNQAFRPDLVLNAINSLPIEFRQLVKEINFYDTFNPADFYWEYQYKMNDFYSQATGGGGVINFFATSNYEPTTIVHEIAHTYDTAYAYFWGVQGRISESSLWLNAMKADQAINGLNGVSSYARESQSSVEDFADSVAYFYSNPHALDNFPNRKALLTQMLPANQTVSSAYDLVMDALTNKYGREVAIEQMEKYLNTGDLKYITRDADARMIISKFSLDDMRLYHDSMTTMSVTINMEAANAFDLAVGAMIRKYGSTVAIDQINAFLQEGKQNYITSSEGARVAISKVSLEDIRTYVRSINNGSLDISNLIG